MGSEAGSQDLTDGLLEQIFTCVCLVEEPDAGAGGPTYRPNRCGPHAAKRAESRIGCLHRLRTRACHRNHRPPLFRRALQRAAPGVPALARGIHVLHSALGPPGAGLVPGAGGAAAAGRAGPHTPLGLHQQVRARLRAHLGGRLRSGLWRAGFGDWPCARA